MRARSVFLLICLFLEARAWAGERLKISCPSCGYETALDDGPGKMAALKKLPYPRAFFCRKTRRFVGLKVDGGDDKQGGSLARETSSPVEPGSEYRVFTHPSCPDALVPIGFFQSRSKPTCPVCGKGELKIKTLIFYD